LPQGKNDKEKLMKLHVVLLTILLAPAAYNWPNTTSSRTIDAAAAFGRLQTLAGDWEANTKMGKARITYELIAGGTALVERESIENMEPMLTVYYLDGDRLLLTHYCMVGNQPRLQAKSYNPDTGEIEFQFLDATNLKRGAGHMHSARLRLVSKTSLESDWDFYENNQLKSRESAQYTRVK
jgi:hypothetical protein